MQPSPRPLARALARSLSGGAGPGGLDLASLAAALGGGGGPGGGGPGGLDLASLAAALGGGGPCGGSGFGTAPAPPPPALGRDPEAAYASQISSLEAMGFCASHGRSAVVEALVETSGNVAAAVDRLLGG